MAPELKALFFGFGGEVAVSVNMLSWRKMIQRFAPG
jgi:hypothetical protein